MYELAQLQHYFAHFFLPFFCFLFCFIWGRIVELISPGPISPHWGVLSKCLAYSKAASDPFVYSLLRHQYRKTCSFLANKVLKRSQLNSSSLRMESSIRRSDTNSNTTNNIHPPSNANKPLGQWKSSPAETMRVLFPQLKVSWIWHLIRGIHSWDEGYDSILTSLWWCNVRACRLITC